MDTWFNASGGGDGQKITIDGSELKDIKCTIKESWLNVGKTPCIHKTGTSSYYFIENAYRYYSIYRGKPVEIDGYLYGIDQNQRNLYKFDEKEYVELCETPYKGSGVYYMCKYKGELYMVYRKYSSNPSNNEIWKYNIDTDSFTKVSTFTAEDVSDIYAALEYKEALHIFTRRVEAQKNYYDHFSFNGTSVTKIETDFSETAKAYSFDHIIGVKDDYLWAFYPKLTMTLKRFNGTSWENFAFEPASIPSGDYYSSMGLIDENNFLYLRQTSIEPVLFELKGNELLPFCHLPFPLGFDTFGTLMRYKGRLTILGARKDLGKGGNGSDYNFFVREKILCLED